MPFSRYTLMTLVAGIAFVGIVAAMKMQQISEQSLLPAALTVEAPAHTVATAAVDSSFYGEAQARTGSTDPNAPTGSSASDGSAVSADPNASTGVTPTTGAAQTEPTASAGSSGSAASAPAPAPAETVSAESYLVGDVSTGKIYLEKNPSTILPAASMSKLITAIAATDTYAPTAMIEITPAETMVPPDGSNLTAGESFTVHDLLYPLLLDSSNVAAEALASTTARGPFLQLMAGYATEIGMSGSFSADPSGLSENDQGSVQGFFTLAQYLYKSRPDILALTRTVSISVASTTDHAAHTFASIHPFVTDPRFLGGKTGHTVAAEDTMLTILNIGGHPIAFIVLRSQDRARDTEMLITKVTGII
jgi:D-alanyl-D-alanine carboxypeptidase